MWSDVFMSFMLKHLGIEDYIEWILLQYNKQELYVLSPKV